MITLEEFIDKSKVLQPYIQVKVLRKWRDPIQRKNARGVILVVNFITEIVQIIQKMKNLKQVKLNKLVISLQRVKQTLEIHSMKMNKK